MDSPYSVKNTTREMRISIVRSMTASQGGFPRPQDDGLPSPEARFADYIDGRAELWQIDPTLRLSAEHIDGGRT